MGSRLAFALALLGAAGCPPADEARCGDGALRPGEACDDANTASGDGCDSACRVEPAWWCQGEPSRCVANATDLGLSACLNGGFDGTENPDPARWRCHTFRAIAGVSMGGGSSSRIASMHPALFDVVGVMGTPFADMDYFFHLIRHTFLGGFCPHEQLLASLPELDLPGAPATSCGPVDLGDLAYPGTACSIFPSWYNSWFRGPDAGRGGGFTRNDLIDVFHDLVFAYGNPLYENPESAILPPGVDAGWFLPPERGDDYAARQALCASPRVVEGVYNLEHNPDGSLPAVTFCDGADGDTGEFWPDHHTLASGSSLGLDGRYGTSQLFPGDRASLHLQERGTTSLYCAEHGGDEEALRVIVEGESCDDGNTDAGDGCSSTCVVEPGFSCAGAPSSCRASCGDRALDPSEGCDDGNTDAGDGCSPRCTVEPGFSCAGVPSSCSRSSCGNGEVEATEVCDDGNLIAGDGCSPWCWLELGFRCVPKGGPCVARCGDGVSDPGEACDDGNADAGDGCDTACALEPGFTCTGAPSRCSRSCGDGAITGAEVCDDGGTAPGDGCDALCQLEPGARCEGEPSRCQATACGNGNVNPGERCDDGNLDAGDGCSPWCLVEAGFACSGNPSTCRETCGNGQLDPTDGAGQCSRGAGACLISITHSRGLGETVRVRPQQELVLQVEPTHTKPIAFALAVDYNRNGRRDYGEPIIDNSEERYQDVGLDGCASAQEDGQGGCGAGGAYDPAANPDPNGDDYSPFGNALGTEGNFRWDPGEPFADDGLDGVPATADTGEGDGQFSQSRNLRATLELSPARRIHAMPQAVFDRIDWWMDAGLRDFINSAQVSNQLWAAITAREADSRSFLGEPALPGFGDGEGFWYLTLDYSPAAIGKNTYMLYGDPAICPGVDADKGLGNHVGPGDQILERLYTMISFTNHRLPEGDFKVIDGDFDQLQGPTGQLTDFLSMQTIHSEALGRDLEFGLVLPPNYYLEPEARFPVFYFLHGQGQSAADLLFSGLVFFTNQKESFLASRSAAGRSDWQKMIIVFADGECREEDCFTGNFYVNFRGLPEGRQYEDALLEVMRHVDATYRTKRPKMLPR